MPRPTDPKLESRILNAARRLWHKNGENALTMRAVAKAADSNTPAVYRRFRNRDDLLLALVQEYQKDLLRALEPCRSLQEIGECYFDFALQRPREYELLMSGLLARVRKAQPNFELLLRRCAEWLGGAPEDHEDFGLALFCLAHGAVMNVLSGNVWERSGDEIRSVFVRALNLLVANAKKFR